MTDPFPERYSCTNVSDALRSVALDFLGHNDDALYLMENVKDSIVPLLPYARPDSGERVPPPLGEETIPGNGNKVVPALACGLFLGWGGLEDGERERQSPYNWQGNGEVVERFSLAALACLEHYGQVDYLSTFEVLDRRIRTCNYMFRRNGSLQGDARSPFLMAAASLMADHPVVKAEAQKLGLIGQKP